MNRVYKGEFVDTLLRWKAPYILCRVWSYRLPN